MKTSVRQGRWLACLLAAALLQVGSAHAQNSEADVRRYQEIFTSKGRSAQLQAAEQLEMAGLSDPRIFDAIEKNLLAVYQVMPTRDDVNYASWLCKALAASGEDKYRATLQEVASNGGHRNLKKHAQNSLDQLETYKKWNRIIGDQSQAQAAGSADNNRYANMLRSNERGLQRLAARHLIESRSQNDYLLGLTQQAVQRDLSIDLRGKEDIDAVAYMLKALAVSGKPQYRATVEQAETQAASAKIRKYAATYLKKY